MDEDAPNFSYAYAGAATPPVSSWNPALRPNNEANEHNASVAHQLQPSPQIIPQSKPELEEGQEDDEDDVPMMPARTSNGAPGHESGSGSESSDRYSQGEDSGSVPRPFEAEANQGGRPYAGQNDLATAAARSNLGETVTEDEQGGANGTRHVGVHEDMEEYDAESSHGRAEDNYEHQGETTLLEEAMAESENAPLVADTASATDDWGASGEVFDVGGMPQDAPLETPLDTFHPEAGGTTVGDETIGHTKVGGNAGEEADGWGNADGDDFFGAAAASQPVEPAQSEESPGAHVVKGSEGQPPAASDSMWDLDMDDDFLPDAGEAAPLFELTDDEGFLEDEPSETSQQPVQPVSAPSTSRYAPAAAAAQVPQPSATPYGVSTPQSGYFSQPNQTSSIPTPNAAYGAYGQPSAYQQPPAGPQMPSSAESFAAKARDGYHSPYDLPEDIVSTRRRPAPRTLSMPAAQPAAPPRTSSMSNAGPARPPLPPSSMTTTGLSSGHSMQPQTTSLPPNAPPKPAPARAPASDFFAELPVTSKPKPSGRYTPQQGTSQPPPAHGLPPKERTASGSSLRNEIRPESHNLISQLHQPERLPVFPDQPTAPMRTNSLPIPQPAPAPPSNRYSPAPAHPPAAPTANARYSPAPPTAPVANARYSPAPASPQGHAAPVASQYGSPSLSGPPRPSSQPYAPRTSSPLAYHTSPHQSRESAPISEQASDSQTILTSADNVSRVPFKTPLEGVSESDELIQPEGMPSPAAVRSQTPPSQSTPPSTVSSPRKRSNYGLQYQSTIPPTAPASTMPPSQRALAHSQSAIATPSAQNVNHIPHRRQDSLQYEFMAPSDERATDPLERWRGYPVFKWGLGGTIVTTFPKRVPRYGGGASAPMVKCSPGEVRIQNVKEALPLSEDITKFPGPLKAKSKKKDVSIWLTRRIEVLEAQLNTPGLDQSVTTDELKRLEEKVLLWKVMLVFIDHDGHLDGNAAVDAAVRKLFSPETDFHTDGEPSLTTAAELVGRSRSNTASVQAEPVEPRAVEELMTLLTRGDREKAVWHAVDQRLWAHAMLLSSTLGKDIWKQVVQEFVQKEVKKMRRNNQALAVLYEIFAGNHEDCIDELVPASARAGFQMVSTDGAGSTQNALQGLDKWRETLSLVLNNRSEGDSAALVSLGKLLAGYGRVEAAHICFIFAWSKAHINGVDDPEADIVLIGADHRQNPLDLGIDLDPVLLTEVYEFGLSLSAQPGSSPIIPHLQNYKLAHAYQLAEYGHRADAQAYCDAIATSMKSTTRISPYYNGSFVAMLDDLSNRLSQSPKDGSSSWISKPSMDKVSNSLLSKFNSFIAGDDEDAASNQSGGEVGPFAKIAGNTPTTLSPVQSSADLYGAYSGFGTSAAAPSAPGNSRYAPSNTYAPRTSTDSNPSRYEPNGRPSLESNDGNTGMRAVSDSYLPSTQTSNTYAPSQSQLNPSAHQSLLSKSHSYSPLRSEYNATETSYGSPYHPTPLGAEGAPAFGGYQPYHTNFGDTPAETTQASSGYEPPSSSFEPPSYQPYRPEEEDSPKQSLKPRKSFMDLSDDDDDLAGRVANLKIRGRSDADRKADEAFRKAAEEDAKRDKEAAAKKSGGGGWFGGWFKKDDNAAPKPIKAKLGEESSFVYDPDLKKWVNKKGGTTEATKPIATPPPPRSGPPSRNVSNNTNNGMGPPSSLPNSNGLAAPPTSNPFQRSSSMPPPAGIPGSRASTPGIPSDTEGPKAPVLVRPSLGSSGPPSRPGTGISTASSIDDLLGAPQARKGAGAKKKKGGRYVDVMAKP